MSVRASGQAVRTKERGLEIQEHGKSDSSNRTITVQTDAIDLLGKRER